MDEFFQRMREATGPAGQLRRRHFSYLTDAEYDVLCLCCADVPLQEAARIRGSSLRTVQKQLVSARRKADVQTTCGLVSKFFML